MYLKFDVKNYDELDLVHDRAVLALLREKTYYDFKGNCREFLVNTLSKFQNIDLGKADWEADLDLSDDIELGVSEHVAKIMFGDSVKSKDLHLIFSSYLSPYIVSCYVWVCRELPKKNVLKFKNVDDIIRYILNKCRKTGDLGTLINTREDFHVAMYLYLHYFGDESDERILALNSTSFNGPSNFIKSNYIVENLQNSVGFFSQYADEIQKFLYPGIELSSNIRNILEEVGIEMPKQPKTAVYFSGEKIILSPDITYVIAKETADYAYQYTNTNMILGAVDPKNNLTILAHRNRLQVANSWPISMDFFSVITYTEAAVILNGEKVPFSIKDGE